MSINSNKLHSNCTPHLVSIQKHAYKYIKAASFNSRRPNKYLKIVRRAKTDLNSPQLPQNPFSNSSLLLCPQALMFLKRFKKYVYVQDSIETTSINYHLRNIFTSIFVNSQTINISEPMSLLDLLPSRSCQALKIIYSSLEEPSSRHAIHKLIKRELRSQIPAALQPKKQSSFRRLSFEEAENDQQRPNTNDSARSRQNKTLRARLHPAIEDRDSYFQCRELTQFFHHCERLIVLEKLVIDIDLTEKSLQFLRRLNQWLISQRSLEIEFFFQNFKLVSQAEKSELSSLTEVWKRVSSIKMNFEEGQTYLIDLVNVISKSSRVFKKLQVNVNEFSEENVINLTSFLSCSTKLASSLNQMTYGEILALLKIDSLSDALEKLTISILEAPRKLKPGACLKKIQMYPLMKKERSL